MIELDPRRLFERLAREIPRALHKHLVIVGSLAAAYHYRDRLKRRAVNTKDADVVVHPAGQVGACRGAAETLLENGWTRTEKCWPQAARTPAGTLRAIRLYPPESRDYFVEFLGLPGPRQRAPLAWRPLRLGDGWYGVACLRHMGRVTVGRRRSAEGLEYASPGSMALANLLSHPTLGAQRMSEPMGGRTLLRSSKDLGRVLALAWLEGREGTAAWGADWRRRLGGPALRKAGLGLRALLADPAALEEARMTTEIGLLSRQGVTAAMLRAVAEELLVLTN
jgi:hypothetical protein